MKKLLFLIVVLTSLSLSLFAQGNSTIKAFIAGHEQNETISLQDLLKADKMQLNEPNYSIVSFKIAFKENGFVVIVSSQSEKISQEMKQKLKNRKDKENVFSVYFEEIVAKSETGEKINVNPIVYKVKTD
jgi:hypothetical protein